jgi:hypothetical protein
MLTPFDPEQHLEVVQAWSAAHGAPCVLETLPANGFISDAAAGWLYLTDSSVGFIEHFVTNPAASLRARHGSVGEIGDALVGVARGLGVRRLISMTAHRSIGRIMRRHGCLYLGPMHVFSLEV